MKRNLIITLISILTVFSIFSLNEKDKVTLKGKVTVQNRLHAELSADSKVYILMLPRYYLNDMKDNDAVEVEGYKLDKNSFPNTNMLSQYDKPNTELFYVTKITAGGKTIDVEKEKGNGRGWNDRGRGFDKRGRMGGRDRRGGDRDNGGCCY
jgi:hypothetical protein